MPYTTVDDLRGALNPGAVQDRATASDLTDAELEDAIGEAQAEVDALLGARYTVPFDDPPNTPPLVAQLTRDVAAYGATLTHRRFQPLDPDHPVRLRYEKAQRMLAALSKGTAVLEGIDLVTASTDVAVQNPYEGELFLPDDFDLGPSAVREPGFG